MFSRELYCGIPSVAKVAKGHQITASLTLVAILMIGGTSYGQSRYGQARYGQARYGQARYGSPVFTPVFQPTPAWPVEMGFSQHHSSTLAEGIRRGNAQETQANANFLLNARQADVLKQQADAIALENWQRRIEIQREMRADREMELQKRTAEARKRNLANRQSQEEARKLAVNRAQAAN